MGNKNPPVSWGMLNLSQLPTGRSFREDHLLCVHEFACLELVEVDTAGETTSVKLNSVRTCNSELVVNKSDDLTTQKVIQD